jgi:hypothetical protein
VPYALALPGVFPRDGNVGIGTTGPLAKLHIVDPAPADANDAQLKISFAGKYLMLGRAASYGFVQSHNGAPLALNPLGNNVGIGTTAPAAKLDVAGTIKAEDATVGVKGHASGLAGQRYGVIGTSDSTEGIGVFGEASATGGTSDGVHCRPSGVLGINSGVYGLTKFPVGRGVTGHASATSGTNYGVYGVTDSASGYAGYFEGRVHFSGYLDQAGGGFKIDHPLDPEDKYLNHSFVESPDMMNVYNGNVRLDANGEAWVELPDYFTALNRDFRYQLTPIGAPAPNLYIAEEISGNRFKIAGGAPEITVSWQVTGIRQDRWANANRVAVDEEKPAVEQGYYMHPELFGKPESMSIEWARDTEGMQSLAERANASPPSSGKGE